MPTNASIVRPLTWESRSPDGIKASRVEVATRHRHHTQALFAQSLIVLRVLAAHRINRHGLLVSIRLYFERASNWSGAPLTKQRITSRPSSSCI
jgi:hypothetical protein